MGEEPSKLTHFGQKKEIDTEDFLMILATFTAFLARSGDTNEFSRFGADFFTSETPSEPPASKK